MFFLGIFFSICEHKWNPGKDLSDHHCVSVCTKATLEREKGLEKKKMFSLSEIGSNFDNQTKPKKAHGV